MLKDSAQPLKYFIGAFDRYNYVMFSKNIIESANQVNVHAELCYCVFWDAAASFLQVFFLQFNIINIASYPFQLSYFNLEEMRALFHVMTNVKKVFK